MPGVILTNSLVTDSRPVLIFDSGVGGLPYLKLAALRCPEETFYYLADGAHYPYGEKDIDTIKSILLSLVGEAVKIFDPKCIIVACNTASVVGLKMLREAFDLPFIGVVPAVKPAAKVASRFGVLATSCTVNDPYLADLIRNFAPAHEVVTIPAANLVSLVESRLFTSSEEERVGEIQKVFENVGPLDSIVLGCTHFIHLEEEFRSFLGSKVDIIDSREGVINQLIRVLDQKGIKSLKKKGENCFFHSPSSNEDNYRKFASFFNLKYSGIFMEDRI